MSKLQKPFANVEENRQWLRHLPHHTPIPVVIQFLGPDVDPDFWTDRPTAGYKAPSAQILPGVIWRKESSCFTHDFAVVSPQAPWGWSTYWSKTPGIPPELIDLYSSAQEARSWVFNLDELGTEASVIAAILPLEKSLLDAAKGTIS